jgi:plastocyanin
MFARTVLAFIAAASIPVIGQSSSGHAAHPAGTHVVTLHHIAFHPQALTIHRNESVTWVWEDPGIAHNVTAHNFHSATQTHGSFTVRFTRTGVFNYRCTIHQDMTGKVIVK